MKKKIFYLFVFLPIISLSQVVGIPDVNFEQALIDLEIDTNGLTGDILRVDAENATELLLNFPLLPNGTINPFADPRVTITEQIQDLTGIEAFVNLTLLGVGYNVLTDIDLSNNTKLDDLFLNDNLLTSIDVSKNTLLKRFGVMRNPSIGLVDVTKNTLLKELFLENTGISTIDLSNNLDLWKFRAQNNNLTGVDASFNAKLTDFNVRYNASLTYLNMRNGNNKNITNIDLRDTSVSCITADGDYVSISPEDSGVSQLMYNFYSPLLSTDCGTVYIPDTNFELALIDLGVDVSGVQDHVILRSEAEMRTDLNLFYPPFNSDLPNVNDKIVDLTGIGAFTNLQSLNAKSNDITELDISNNLALKYLYFGGNELTTIDVSNNTSLEYLDVLNNDLNELDVSQNTLIQTLAASYNNLNTINVSNNINATWVELNNNNLTSIDISNNTQLEILNINNNQLDDIVFGNHNSLRQIVIRNNNLSEIDISNFSSLEIFFANNNLFTELDLSSNTNLTSINISNNLLTFLNVKNGNNSSINYFQSLNNPDLKCIQVDANIVGTSPVDWTKDDFAVYSSDCDLKPEYVFIPDSNFEQALIDLEIDSDGVVNTYILRNDAEAVNVLNASFPLLPDGRANPFADSRVTITEKITDLTGIEAFVNLNVLQADFNALTAVDVSQNTQLKDLTLAINSITTLDVSSNLLLEYLNVNNNPLTTLDVTQNTNLDELSIDNLQISDLELSNNLALKAFYASNLSNLTHIDFSKNSALTNILITGSSLETLDLSNNLSAAFIYLNDNLLLSHLDLRNTNNMNFSYFTATNTPNLTCINADANYDPLVDTEIPAEISQAMVDSGKTFSEDCGDFVYIPDPNFEQSLIDIGIDSDGVVNASILREDAAGVTSLNLTNPLFQSDGFQNPLITSVSGKISDLNGIEAFISLTDLQLGNGALASVNLTQNINLESLFLNDNQLTSIDISKNTLIKRFGVMGNPISGTVDVSSNLLLEELFLNDTGINTIDLSNNSNLWKLFIQRNNLVDLNVTVNTNLIDIRCQDNLLSQLDITTLTVIDRIDAQFNSNFTLITDVNIGNPTLRSLNLSGTGLTNFNGAPYLNLQWLILNTNNLSRFNGNNNLLVENLFLNNNSIDKLSLSVNNLLKQLHVNNNVLTELDLANGNNIELQTMNATGNLLTCIGVDNDLDANNNLAPYNLWNVDFGVTYSVNCKGAPEVILISDSNFEAALVPYDTNGMNGNILVTDAEAITSLDVSGSSIIDLTGIEGFVNLTDLNVSGNLLEELDLTENTAIANLDVSDNFLNNLVINSGRNLQTLDISSNLFQTIDVSGFSNLTVFDATFNPNLLCIGVSDPNNIPVGWSKDPDPLAKYSSDADCIIPTILAQDVTIYLNSRGKASVTASAFNNGSTDNVTVPENLTFEVSQSDFDCSHLGLNRIDFTVYDEAGNGVYQTVNLYVEDDIAPSVIASNPYTYDLNGMSAYTIAAEDVVKSVSDNCSDPILSIDQSIFTSTGTFTVTLTATDLSGNTAEDTIDITIEDSASGSGTASLGFKKNLNLTIYPVPFSDVININFSKTTDLNLVSVQLLDFGMNSTGITFSPNGSDLISNSTDGLIPGLYILQITVGTETKTAQIIKD